MKYHGHEIKKVHADLDDWDGKNYIYEIYKDGKFLADALVLSSAKDYIDSGYNENYL